MLPPFHIVIIFVTPLERTVSKDKMMNCDFNVCWCYVLVQYSTLVIAYVAISKVMLIIDVSFIFVCVIQICMGKNIVGNDCSTIYQPTLRNQFRLYKNILAITLKIILTDAVPKYHTLASTSSRRLRKDFCGCRFDLNDHAESLLLWITLSRYRVHWTKTWFS